MIASPQTSFGVRSSRIHFSPTDERAPKDVCGEARVMINCRFDVIGSVPLLSTQEVACATDETKLCLSPSVKQRRNPCSGFPPVY